jgi:hypothetical protein
MKTTEIHAMIQENTRINNTNKAGQEPFASQKRCLMTLRDTLRKFDSSEVSSGSLQQILRAYSETSLKELLAILPFIRHCL